MKVVKILAVVFGVLLLLAGAGLLVGSKLVATGQSTVDRQMAQSGFVGPVHGVVTTVEQGTQITATFTDQQGEAHTGVGVAAISPMPKVGDTVSLYYSSSDPEQIIVYDLPGGSLSSIASGLRTAGIICLVVGGLLLIAGIAGLVVGTKAAPAVAAGPASPPGPADPVPPGYQSAPSGGSPPPGYPPQPGYGPPPQQPYGNPPPQPPYGGPPLPPYGNPPPPYENPAQPPGQQPPGPREDPPSAPPSAG